MEICFVIKSRHFAPKKLKLCRCVVFHETTGYDFPHPTLFSSIRFQQTKQTADHFLLTSYTSGRSAMNEMDVEETEEIVHCKES